MLGGDKKERKKKTWKPAEPSRRAPMAEATRRRCLTGDKWTTDRSDGLLAAVAMILMATTTKWHGLAPGNATMALSEGLREVVYRSEWCQGAG